MTGSTPHSTTGPIARVCGRVPSVVCVIFVRLPADRFGDVCIELPIQQQEAVSWVLDAESLPDIVDSGAGLRLASPLFTTSAGPLTLSLILSRNSSRVPLVIVNDTILLDMRIAADLNNNEFPLRGTITGTDARTQCLQSKLQAKPGPCSSSMPFSLTLAQFNPTCPPDIIAFGSSDDQVSWTEPRLATISGDVVQLHSSAASNGRFLIGQHTVTYSPATGFDPSQPIISRPVCSFQVNTKSCHV